MSWNFSGSGNNREEAFTNFVEKGQEAEPHCPFLRTIIDSAATLTKPFPADVVKSIRSYGHINTDGTGSMAVLINC